MSSLPPQDENTDPDTGQKIQSKSQKRKRELKEIKQALEKVQENEARQRQIIHDQALTIEKLKACDDTQHSDDSSSDDEQRPHTKKKKNNDAASNDLLRKDALQSGKRFAVESSLWTEPGAVQYLALLNDNGSDAVQANEQEDEDEELRSQAQLIYANLPAHLRPHVQTAWFRKRFQEGGKSIRSNQAHHLARLFPTYIFPELPATFSDKALRPHLPEVMALLKNKRFLYDREPKTSKAALEGHLRNPCILKTLKCVLHGPAAVTNGKKSPKARSTNAHLWGCTQVTNEMLAFAATLDYFILSGESEFTEQGASHDFRQFYDTRIKILQKESSKGPKARERYEDLMKYFNENLFPADEAPDSDVDEEEAMLLKAISDEENEGDENEVNGDDENEDEENEGEN